MKDTRNNPEFNLNIRGNLRNFRTPLVMSILNVTPDSFYDGGKHMGLEDMRGGIANMVQNGADIIDIGGYSTRPGASEISIQEEIDRVLPAIKFIKKHFPQTLISLDTFRSEVAQVGLENDVDIVNDVSGGRLDENMFSVVSKFKAPYILMHMRGNPTNMQDLTKYKNVFTDVAKELSEQILEATKAGINDIIIDPGFGFAKTLEQNFEIFAHLNKFQAFEKPLLIGISRKSMIYKLLESTSKDSLNGTTVLNTLALERGAKILRVHDTKEAKEAIKLWQATTH